MAGISQQIDSRVSAEVAEYIKKRVKKEAEMRRLIKIFVKNGLLQSDNLQNQNKRHFYPRSRVIPSLIYRTIKSLRKSMINQECLIDKIEQWKLVLVLSLVTSTKCHRFYGFRFIDDI